MRLLCDEMLAGLARWLRAAGHDAALLAPGTRDDAVLDRCRTEHRVLVSRDRRLVGEAGAALPAVLLKGETMDDHARALTDALGLDWSFAPFTRCLVDNTPLRSASENELERVPARPRALPGPFRVCPRCGRVFWPGSHVRRMSARLEHWRGLASRQTIHQQSFN